MSDREGEAENGIDRRGLLGGAAAGAAGYAASGALDPALARRRRRRRRDVIVVGAGIAGLSAARRLHRSGYSVAVLEGRNRVGGRTLNRHIGHGRVLEIGGQWVGPTQDRVLRLIDELGLETFDTYAKGENVYWRDGSRSTYTGTIPPANAASLAEIAVALELLNQMASEVPPEAPWEATRAAEWDAQTFETWKLDNMRTAEARDLLDLAIEAVFAAQPRDVSLLYVLFYIAAAAGDINLLIDTEGGAQERRVVGGSQLISLRMARELGRAVRLGSPVRAIRRRGSSHVEVRTRGELWIAKRVISALPPAVGPTLRHFPKLPARRAQLEQRVPMGSVVKCMAIYERPFWRDEGLSGMATSNTGPVKVTFDNTPPQGTPGVLLGFIEGQEAREWTARSARARREAVIGSLERYFGRRARTGVIGYLEKSWAEDRWSRGCYVGFTPPGVLIGFGDALKEPIGGIHWAGTETASAWAGYMDGAVESGHRAASEVTAEL